MHFREWTDVDASAGYLASDHVSLGLDDNQRGHHYYPRGWWVWRRRAYDRRR